MLKILNGRVESRSIPSQNAIKKKNDFTMIYSKPRVYSLLFRSIMKNTVENYP